MERLIENVDYLIVNRDFPCRLMKEKDLEAALRGIGQRYGCRLTAAPLGEEGVLAWDGKDFVRRSASRHDQAATEILADDRCRS